MYISCFPSLKNAALIFLEIFLIQYFTVLVEQFMTSSLSSFASYKNVNISKTKEDIPKRKTPFFVILKRLSNKQQVVFYFIGTLKCHYDENRILQIRAILRHKEVVYTRVKMLFTVFKYLFSFQRYSSF